MAGDLLIALGVVALGLFLLWGSKDISLGAGYDRVGPRFFPYAVAAGLIGLGGWLTLATILGTRTKPQVAEPTSPEQAMNWAAVGWLALALVANLALLERGGFVVASSVQFWLAARAFHSRRPGRDALVAVLLSIVVYLSFSQLGLTLPAGILEGIF